MRKSLGDKRREIPPERAQEILAILAAFKDGDTRTVTRDGKPGEVVVSRIFRTPHFGFRKITVERPLRLTTARRDPKDGQVGLAGYEINFNCGARAVASARALVAKVREAIDRLKELRTALISSAVTGGIDARGEAPDRTAGSPPAG